MIVQCNSERWSYVGKIMRGALGADAKPCGRTYDDLTHSTICPHRPLYGEEAAVCKVTDLYCVVCPHCKHLEKI